MLPRKTDVLVVGAGPAGLAAGAALAQRGVDVTVVDRQAEGANTSRAAVVHARTLAVLDTIGAATPLVARGIRADHVTLRDRERTLIPISFADLPTSRPYALLVSQAETEAVLLERLVAAGGAVFRPHTVVAIDGHAVRFADGTVMRAHYIVGADGMHSTVRAAAGIAFPDAHRGTEESFLLADVRVTADLPRDEVVLFFSRDGMLVWAPLPGGTVRIVAAVPDPPSQPSVADVQRLIDDRGPRRTSVTVTDVVWGSRFRVHHRVATRFRRGPVLLAGDAAHVHSPAGGQGMNLGLRDAVAAADALGSVLDGAAEDALDAYDASRRPIAHEVVDFANRLTRLATVPAPARPLRNAALGLLAQSPRFRRRVAERLSGLADR